MLFFLFVLFFLSCFRYADHAVTDQAVAALHGMKIGDKSLIVQRSSSGGPASAVPAVPSDAAAAHPGAAACLSLQIPLVSILQSLPDIDRNAEPSAMLVLVNLFRPKDLAAEEDYLDALAEVRGEMEQFGKLLDLQIVRPRADIDPATAQLEGTKVRFSFFLWWSSQVFAGGGSVAGGQLRLHLLPVPDAGRGAGGAKGHSGPPLQRPLRRLLPRPAPQRAGPMKKRE